ncbi:GNAT family N-acetyltransferase [Niallia sp. 01092]|uniref:GNAT family N-acetyltransferase n=1 Tax=unclassified Niallia TaxID=2837522 RepID=UPI003FD67F0B
MKHTTTMLEELAMNAQPCAVTMLLDGWIIRFNDGYTKRGNSVQPLYFSSMSLEEKIQEVEQIYVKKEMPVIFKMTEEACPKELDGILETKGYGFLDETSVQTRSLHDISPVSSLTNAVEMYDYFTEEWLEHYCRLNKVNKTNHSTLVHMLRTIIPDTCYVLLKEGSEVVSCGLGVRQGKYIGLFDIVTNSDYRRKGYGKALVQSILQWGKNEGAEYAYLQVMVKNKPAITLYQTCGFQESYRYWYRIKEKKENRFCG